MAETLINVIKKVFLSVPANTTLSIEQIATEINTRKMFIKEGGTDVTPTEVAYSLVDSLEKDDASILAVSIKVKMKKPKTSYAIGGKRVSRRSMLDYLKLQKEYDKPSSKPDSSMVLKRKHLTPSEERLRLENPALRHDLELMLRVDQALKKHPLKPQYLPKQKQR